MGLLGDVYSAADSIKRRLRGLLSDPIGGVQQSLGMLADDAKVANERNKRMIHNPEQITEQDMRDSFNSAMNFAPIGMLAKAPRAEAMRIAQQNAAKPISEGGLGLRPDNTPMERAQAMGFKHEGFHGTANDFIAFDKSKLGTSTDHPQAELGFFFSPKTSTASKYPYQQKEGQNVIPALLKQHNAYSMPLDEFYGTQFKRIAGKDPARQFRSELEGMGYDGIQLGKAKQPLDLEEEGVRIVFDPSNIRSRFAAFDPARRHEADLLGQVNPELLPWLIGGGLLGGYGVKQAQE